jgi:signal transduction histidine kinase
VSWRRLLAAGCAAAALVGLGGGLLDFWRFGPNDAATAARVEAGVRRRFDEMTAALSGVADKLTSNPATAQALAAETDGDRTLFDLVAAARPASSPNDAIAITIYSKDGVARAWLGRPSDTFQRDRTTGPAVFFVSPSPLGLRLVHIRPIVGTDGRRMGSVAAEHDLSPAAAPTTMMSENFTLVTPIAPVSLRMRWAGAGENPAPGAFVLRDPSGEPLAEATVNDADLRRARSEWRRSIAGVVLAVGGVVLLLLIGPLLDRRLRLGDSASFVRVSLEASLLLLSGAGVIWLASRLASGAWPSTSTTLILAGISASALAALWASPAVRLRLALKARRLPADAPVAFTLMQLTAGFAVGGLLALYEGLLDSVVDPNSVDLRHFSLYPWNPDRIGLLAGILGLNIAVLWAAGLILVAAAAAWRMRRSLSNGALLLALWAAPIVIVVSVAASRGWPLPSGAMMMATFACGFAAFFGQRLATWYRHTTVAARIFALFLAFLFPALLLYQSVNYFAERATRRLVATQYAVEVQKHDQRLRDAMSQAMNEINALTELPDLVAGAPDVLLASPRTESAFLVWSQTTLARERLTSAVELYDRKGDLVSRFALNFPEYTGTAQKPQPTLSCTWDLFGESQPFGSEERNMLHAERRICDDSPGGGAQTVVGTVVVHVLLRDYRTLPFITSESPYFELFRATDRGVPADTPAGGDVSVAIYGWGLQTLYASERSAWPITDALFRRIYDPDRTPFWEQIPLGGRLYNVYFSNDRAAIYALGYPSLTLFDRLVHIAELTTLAGIAFVVVLLGTAVFTRIGRERPRVGRALLREIRASFYRKLFLAFVLAAVIPVLTLALVIRAYFADLLRNDVQAEAARTAAVAQRVIEESDALQRRSANRLAPVSDDIMVWISQVIDQDVNIFNGAQLVATSERDLFSSGLLPTRTPDDVYRAITLQRLPSFVGEDEIGAFPYMIAAAPVRAGEKDMILTVPLANRQREIERQIADLDRGVHLAALCFILLGAAIGLSLAERIADPVRRLTRATRRIARGDFDARIAVRSADELKRLVDAFNAMAAELAKQRVQLERTHRLEAWAEMARQVAHEIKNPLTPIQLSAEHLQRVHADRGEPLGPVLESCVSSILGQVRLLRQIAAEFSSFASSPTARLAPVDVPPLVAEVVDPYRTGLTGRIEIDNRATGPLPRVQVDRTLVARALANIVENALHAMPGKGRLDIDAAATDGHVTVQVRDTGVGMDKDALARVFEPYFSTKTTGTGLGLPIARRNIELSGGTIEVESEKGVGTTVRITLPQESVT